MGNAALTTSSRCESQPPPLRGTSFRGKEGVCRLLASSFRAKARNLFRSRSRSAVRRGIMGNAALTTSSRCESQPPPLRGTSFRGKEGVCRLPTSSFRAKARNLFRLRSGKRGEDDGSREAPHSLRRGITVLHANSFTKENGNGKRKRSLDCARDDNTGEGCLTFPFIPRRE